MFSLPTPVILNAHIVPIVCIPMFWKKTYGLNKQYMSIDTMALVIEQSKLFEPYKLLSFMGHGEPLLCRDLPKMVAMAAEAEVAQRIEIITNASLLTHVCSDALIDAGLTNLRVSLQGLNADAYRKTSGAVLDFEKFMEQLSYFYEKKKPGMGLFVKVLDVSLHEGEEEMFYKMFDAISDRMYVEHVQLRRRRQKNVKTVMGMSIRLERYAL